MTDHIFNQHGKPKRCKCGGRPIEKPISFPHYINIHCHECDEMIGIWREGKFITPEEAGF